MKHERVMYGGAFNPPHRDHTGIISRLLEEVADTVLIIPTGKRIDKEYMGVSDAHREYMIRLATEEYGAQVEVDTTFLYGDMPTTTLHQARYLEEKYHREIPQVFGSDVAPKMSGWDPTGYVPYRLPKVFIARPGYPIASDTVGNYETVEYESRGFSSTAVRQAVEQILRGDSRAADDISKMVHDKVAHFIFQNGLFVPSE